MQIQFIFSLLLWHSTKRYFNKYKKESSTVFPFYVCVQIFASYNIKRKCNILLYNISYFNRNRVFFYSNNTQNILQSWKLANNNPVLPTTHKKFQINIF